MSEFIVLTLYGKYGILILILKNVNPWCDNTGRTLRFKENSL